MDYIKNRITELTKIDFVRFCIVGGLGFIVNLILLTILHKLFNIPIFAAQFFGSEIALFNNFLLHHYWTYKYKKVQKKKRNLILQFHATSWPAILGSTVMVGVLVDSFKFDSTEALIIASLTALFWNFLWSKYVVWNDIAQDKRNIVAEKTLVELH